MFSFPSYKSLVSAVREKENRKKKKKKTHFRIETFRFFTIHWVAAIRSSRLNIGESEEVEESLPKWIIKLNNNCEKLRCSFFVCRLIRFFFLCMLKKRIFVCFWWRVTASCCVENRIIHIKIEKKNKLKGKQFFCCCETETSQNRKKTSMKNCLSDKKKENEENESQSWAIKIQGLSNDYVNKRIFGKLKIKEKKEKWKKNNQQKKRRKYLTSQGKYSENSAK